MSDFIAHVIAELDTSKAEAQINALTSKKYKLQFDTVDTASMMKNLESDMAKAGKDAGSSFSKNLSQSLSSANVNKQFSSINNSIAQTNKNLNNVNVHGFGRFETYRTKARVGTDPNTLEKKYWDSNRVAKFSPSVFLANRLRAAE